MGSASATTSPAPRRRPLRRARSTSAASRVDLPPRRPRPRLGPDRGRAPALRIVVAGDYKRRPTRPARLRAGRPATSSSPRRPSACRSSATRDADARDRQAPALARAVPRAHPSRRRLRARQGAAPDRAAARRRLRRADLPPRRAAPALRLLRRARHRPRRPARRSRDAKSATSPARSSSARPRPSRRPGSAASPTRCRLRLRLDAGPRPRPPARRRAAAGHLRPLRLGRADRHHRRDRRRPRSGSPTAARRRWSAGARSQRHSRPGRSTSSAPTTSDETRRRCPRQRREPGEDATMRRFADLLDRLAYEPGRNAKLRLIDRLSPRHARPRPRLGARRAHRRPDLPAAKPAMLRDLVAERVDPELFALSYDLSATSPRPSR